MVFPSLVNQCQIKLDPSWFPPLSDPPSITSTSNPSASPTDSVCKIYHQAAIKEFLGYGRHNWKESDFKFIQAVGRIHFLEAVCLRDLAFGWRLSEIPRGCLYVLATWVPPTEPLIPSILRQESLASSLLTEFHTVTVWWRCTPSSAIQHPLVPGETSHRFDHI